MSCLVAIGMLAARAEAGSDSSPRWTPATWNGEAAFVLATPRWKAVVSVDRGRLVVFQPTVENVNVLYAPPDAKGRFGWGGHRVWLGPQADWPGGWPPPDAWEASAAESVKAGGGRLELTVPPAPGGWPRLTRIYEWSEGRLICRVRASGGSRPAQIIQIFQTPPKTRVRAWAQPSDRWPRGFVSLRLGGRGEPPADFSIPPQVRINGNQLMLHYTGAWVKLGFRPQELQAANGTVGFAIGAPQFSGRSAGTPDAGFFTQVYLGDPASPVVELEQLSPLIAPGGTAELAVSLEL
jgi:hypothetical protein